MPTGKIQLSAKGEIPLTWDALEKYPEYGTSFLDRKSAVVMTRLFGSTLSESEQDALDDLVIDYAGKLLALAVIGAGIDYWGKQPLSIGATGRNENKGFKDRAQDLRTLRAQLLEETRLTWPDVEQLLPDRRGNRVPNVPRVSDIQNAHTPSPYLFEAPFAPVEEA